MKHPQFPILVVACAIIVACDSRSKWGLSPLPRAGETRDAPRAMIPLALDAQQIDKLGQRLSIPNLSQDGRALVTRNAAGSQLIIRQETQVVFVGSRGWLSTIDCHGRIGTVDSSGEWQEWWDGGLDIHFKGGATLRLPPSARMEVSRGGGFFAVVQTGHPSTVRSTARPHDVLAVLGQGSRQGLVLGDRHPPPIDQGLARLFESGDGTQLYVTLWAAAGAVDVLRLDISRENVVTSESRIQIPRPPGDPKAHVAVVDIDAEAGNYLLVAHYSPPMSYRTAVHEYRVSDGTYRRLGGLQGQSMYLERSFAQQLAEWTQ